MHVYWFQDLKIGHLKQVQVLLDELSKENELVITKIHCPERSIFNWLKSFLSNDSIQSQQDDLTLLVGAGQLGSRYLQGLSTVKLDLCITVVDPSDLSLNKAKKRWVEVGGDESQEQLRACLALGADRAILAQSEGLLEPLAIAKVLTKIVESENPNLVILGKQAIDGDNNQTGQMLAAMLDMPQATFASELKIEGDNAVVTREIDGGLQTISVNLPAVVTTDLRLNEPRYASLPNIMQAKKKDLSILNVSDLGIDVSDRTSILSVELPPTREAGVMVDSVEELVEKLKNEAKVIT